MEEFGGFLIAVGVIALFCGQPAGIIVGIIGFVLYNLGSAKREEETRKRQLREYEQRKQEEAELLFKTFPQRRVTASKSNLYEPKTSSKQDDFEVYVQVQFDNYHKTYTYLAPNDRFLKTGERIRIMTNEGIKSVTVVKGNYNCPKKTDMYYKRIDIR